MYFPGMEGSGYALDILHMYGYKILAMMGATDGMITIPGTWKWIKDRKLKKTQEWTPYLVNDDLFGYTKEYQDLKFVSVIGVG